MRCHIIMRDCIRICSTVAVRRAAQTATKTQPLVGFGCQLHPGSVYSMMLVDGQSWAGRTLVSWILLVAYYIVYLLYNQKREFWTLNSEQGLLTAFVAMLVATVIIIIITVCTIYFQNEWNEVNEWWIKLSEGVFFFF